MSDETSSAEQWRIEKLVPGGAGFARRADGSPGFVNGALPGELVSVSRLRVKKGYTVAGACEVLEPSAQRVEPACPIARECGGCDWMHLAYDAQLQHKALLLAEALRRTGGFQAWPSIAVVPSPLTSHYRVRIRLHVGEGGRIGFFAAESRRLVPVQSCAAARPELNAALGELTLIARRFPRELARFSELELRAAPAAEKVSLALVPRAPSAKPPASALLRELSARFQVVVAGGELAASQRYPLAAELDLEVPAGAFVQVNWEINLAIVQRIVEGTRRRGARSFLDVYAGAGNFTLPLAALGLAGVSVEAHALAAAGCRRALDGYGFKAVRVMQDDVARALDRLAARSERFELVVLDPPRSGARDILPSLRRLAAPHVAYLSCDPVTLARDLRELVALGYHLESLTGFDMFPGTHHLETLAWLELRADE